VQRHVGRLARALHRRDEFVGDPRRVGDQYTFTRQQERFLVDFAVEVFSFTQRGATMAKVSDLSTFGMAFYAPMELVPDQEVQLHFSLPYSRMKFAISAMVRSVNDFRIGVEFERLTASETAELERILKILTAQA